MIESPGQVIRILAVLGTIAGAAYAPGQESELIVRLTTEPEQAAWVGQRVVLRIDVLARDTWANLPTLPSVNISGAFVYTPPVQNQRLSEQIDGASFSGQRYELWIYTQREGELQIPSLNLNVQLNVLGAGQTPESKSATTEATKLDVRFPPGLPAATGAICASAFSAEQRWQPDSGPFKVGDGVTRTIQRTVDDVPAMALAPLQTRDIEGVRTYPKQPKVEDAFDRGSLTGKRTDSITYVFEAAGKIELPSLRLAWWDPEVEAQRTIELDGLELEVEPGEEVAGVTGAQADSREVDPWRSLWRVVGLVAIAGLIVWFRRAFLESLGSWRERIAASEGAYFRHFVAAAKTDRPAATLRALVQWLDVAAADDPAPRLDQFLEQFGDSSSARQVASLEAAVNSASSSWQSGDFVSRIRRARRKWLAARRHQVAATSSCLPPLYSKSP